MRSSASSRVPDSLPPILGPEWLQIAYPPRAGPGRVARRSRTMPKIQQIGRMHPSPFKSPSFASFPPRRGKDVATWASTCFAMLAQGDLASPEITTAIGFLTVLQRVYVFAALLVVAAT